MIRADALENALLTVIGEAFGINLAGCAQIQGFFLCVMRVTDLAMIGKRHLACAEDFGRAVLLARVPRRDERAAPHADRGFARSVHVGVIGLGVAHK